MVTFLVILLVCLSIFLLSMISGHDIDLGDALDFTEDGGSGWLSIRFITLFGIGFGAVGLLSGYAGIDALASAALGAVGGGLMGVVGWQLSTILLKQESNSTPDLNNLINRNAIVTIGITMTTTGEVMLRNEFGHVVYIPARSTNALAPGSQAVIRGVHGVMVWVE